MVVPLISIILLCPLAAFADLWTFGLGETEFSATGLSVNSGNACRVRSVRFCCYGKSYPTRKHILLSGFHSAVLHSLWAFYLDSVTVIMLGLLSHSLVVSSISSLWGTCTVTRGIQGFLPTYRFSPFRCSFWLFRITCSASISAGNLLGFAPISSLAFWFEKDSAANACKKAFLTTRVGDVGMFIGMMMLFTKFKTLSLYGEGGIFALVASLDTGDMVWLSIAGVLIFCGAVGKSAQVPLHTWLPDAMEGPTPVSALIHAATMVAARRVSHSSDVSQF